MIPGGGGGGVAVGVVIAELEVGLLDRFVGLGCGWFGGGAFL